MYVQTDDAGAGFGVVVPDQGEMDLMIICKGDWGLAFDTFGNRDVVSYNKTESGAPADRLDQLVNGSQTTEIGILPVGSGFVLNDSTAITAIAGRALPPVNSGLPGAALNTTNDCLVIYDTSMNNGHGYCVARLGTGGVNDLPMTTAILLYNKLSYAYRIVTNSTLSNVFSGGTSPEATAAINDENDLRTQIAASSGVTPVLRDPNNASMFAPTTGSQCIPPCCIIASVASGSPISPEVQALRAVRDTVLRRTEIGFAFFRRFFFDYYSFSPQVSVIAAGSPALREQILESFVRPLIAILGIMERYASGDHDDAALGALFAQVAGPPEAAAATLQRLRDADRLWKGDLSAVDGYAGGVDLLDLLQDRAWPSEHVTWALIAPVAIHADALEARIDGETAAALGRRLRRAFDAWACEMPLDHIWGALSRTEVDRELAALDGMMLRSEKARRRFRARLIERFPGISSIERLGGSERLQ